MIENAGAMRDFIDEVNRVAAEIFGNLPAIADALVQDDTWTPDLV